ncbi:MAG: DUF485 domain-containing protein [Coriobacteriia bacterium]
MGDSTTHAPAALSADGRQIQHGDHIDTIESVDTVFRAQRKLSFTYGAVFFVVTLGVPASSVWWTAWYSVEILGGFTANYLFVGLFYFVFLWVMAWTYAKQADRLDERLLAMADDIATNTMNGGVQS